MLRIVTLVGWIFVAFGSQGFSGEFNTKMKIGDSAPRFAGLQGVDGKAYSFDDFQKKKLLLVVVTCNHCPVALAYEDRLIQLNKTFADSSVGVVAINVSLLEEDNLEKMKEHSAEKSFNFPYVIDPSQNTGRALGATATPQFFLFDSERKLIYMGALDDNLIEKKARTPYLANAIQAALKGGKIEKAETKPVGCGIKYEKKSS